MTAACSSLVAYIMFWTTVTSVEKTVMDKRAVSAGYFDSIIEAKLFTRVVHSVGSRDREPSIMSAVSRMVKFTHSQYPTTKCSQSFVGASVGITVGDTDGLALGKCEGSSVVGLRDGCVGLVLGW